MIPPSNAFLSLASSPCCRRLLTVDTHGFVFQTAYMFSVIKAVAIAVIALFLIAPTLASADCDDAHESDCVEECVCLCQAGAAIAHNDSTPGLATLDTSRLCVAADTFVGDLLPVDIFRPPAAS